MSTQELSRAIIYVVSVKQELLYSKKHKHRLSSEHVLETLENYLSSKTTFQKDL